MSIRLVSGSVVLGLAGIVVLIAVNAAVSYWNVSQLNEDSRWVIHTHEVMDALEASRVQLHEAAAVQRAVVLGGEQLPPSFFQHIESARLNVQRVQGLTADNPSQQARIPNLEQRINGLAEGWSRTAAERTKPGVSAQQLAHEQRQNDAALAVVDDKFRRMDDEERRLLTMREQQTERAYHIARTAAVLAAMLGLAAVAVLVWLLDRFLRSQRGAAAAIDEQRQLLHATLASVGDAVIATDALGRVTFLNPIAEQLTGWSKDDGVGTPLETVFNIVNEVTRESVENPALRAAKEGAIIGLANHTILIDKSGRERPIDDSAAPIRNRDGAVVGAVLVFRDVSEKRAAEIALRGSEERLSLAVDTAELGLWDWDVRTGDVLWNAHHERIFGYTPGQPRRTYRDFADRVPPEDLKRLEGSFRLAQAERRDYHLQHRVVWPEGTVRWVEAVGRFHFDGAGEPVRSVGVVMDVTERKQAEQELQRAKENLHASEERFRSFAENGPQIIWSTDADGAVRYVNQRWSAYTGLTSEEATEAEKLRSVVHPDDYIPLMKHWDESRTRATPFEFEYRLKRASDGAYRWFLSRGVPLRDNQGRVVHWVGAMADIQDQKRAEEELRDTDRRKDEFLATLAHELRNPLAPIRNGLQLLRIASDNPAALAQARTVMERQLSQMVRLVDDLLDLSRISQGKLELRREPTLLADVIASAVETSRPLIDQMGHMLTVALPEQPVVLDADLTRFAQVVMNLLNNAAKYTRQGGRIWLTAALQGSELELSVRDTGIGIAADHLPRIFRMFSQLEPSLERSQGGLGIGLTLVKRLVEMHGGSVYASSEGTGKGAEFTVRVPARLEPAAPKHTERKDEAEVKTSLSILIVDDNRDCADSLALILQLLGNETHTAYDGEEGVAAASKFKPNVIFLDIGLPKLNGYEACRRIRQQPWGKQIVIIAQTGWGQDDDRQRTREAGFDHHLVKPIDTNNVMKLLADVQNDKRASE